MLYCLPALSRRYECIVDCLASAKSTKDTLNNCLFEAVKAHRIEANGGDSSANDAETEKTKPETDKKETTERTNDDVAKEDNIEKEEKREKEGKEERQCKRHHGHHRLLHPRLCCPHQVEQPTTYQRPKH